MLEQRDVRNRTQKVEYPGDKLIVGAKKDVIFNHYTTTSNRERQKILKIKIDRNFVLPKKERLEGKNIYRKIQVL